MSEPINEEAPSPFMPCPICGSSTRMTLVDGWNDGRAIPIVGCGNPWHYTNLDRPAPQPLDVERLARLLKERYGDAAFGIAVGNLSLERFRLDAKSILARLGSQDYGICANPASPLDGAITFEHGGCPQHSSLVGEGSECACGFDTSTSGARSDVVCPKHDGVFIVGGEGSE